MAEQCGRLPLVLLVLWDIDGTLVHSAGHGRDAFEEAFRAVVGREPEPVDYGGRTDQQIALAMLDGEREHLPRVLEELAERARARKEAMRDDGHAYPGVAEVLEALHGRDDVIQSLLTGNIQANAALKVSAFGLERWLDFEVGAYGSDPHERALRPGGRGARAGGGEVRRSRPAPCWWATRRSTCRPRTRPAPARWRWPPASPSAARSRASGPTRCSTT